MERRRWPRQRGLRRGLATEDIQELTMHADVRTVMIYLDNDGRNERVAAITDDLGRVMRDDRRGRPCL
ncbi:hypothetical protein [Kribbella sp. NPDC051620]|uniref:hypothetical protein n=1 Tax=Kribbella sp. NPDC051620 TaxID=3364120 RepID=UPI0037BCA48A